MSEWKPIESAPKTGERVLLSLGGHVVVACWYSPWGNWQAGDIPADPIREEYHGIGSEAPTHWMPVPEAPK